MKVIPRRITDPTDEGSVFSRFNFEQAKTANTTATPGSHNDGRAKNLLQFTISRHHEGIKITHIMEDVMMTISHYSYRGQWRNREPKIRN